MEKEDGFTHIDPMEKEDRWRNRKVFEQKVEVVRALAPTPLPRPHWPEGLFEAYRAQSIPAPYAEEAKVDFDKWRILHKFVHRHPFHPDPGLSRGDQWRSMRRYIDDELGDPDILAWIDQQAEINDNRDRGTQDLRPRKDGPCHELLLEYVGNRKRKALAIHHFAIAQEK